jgi:hypothetical protein
MAPMKETSRIIIQCSNTVNKKQTLKVERELWITPSSDDRYWALLVWLLSRSEVRQILIATKADSLPVIHF